MFSVDRQGGCDHSLRDPGCLSSYHLESQTGKGQGRENLSLISTSQCSVLKAARVISAVYSLTKTTRPHPMTWEPESTILPEPRRLITLVNSTNSHHNILNKYLVTDSHFFPQKELMDVSYFLLDSLFFLFLRT